MEVTYLDLIRIGDKLISLSRIESIVQEMLDLRQQGVSQAEVAKKFNTDKKRQNHRSGGGSCKEY